MRMSIRASMWRDLTDSGLTVISSGAFRIQSERKYYLETVSIYEGGEHSESCSLLSAPDCYIIGP